MLLFIRFFSSSIWCPIEVWLRRCGLVAASSLGPSCHFLNSPLGFSLSAFWFLLFDLAPAPARLNRRQAAAVVAHLVRPSKMGGGFAKCLVSKLREHSPVK